MKGYLRLVLYPSMVQIARNNLALALECQKEVSALRDRLKNLEGDEAEYFLGNELIPVESKLDNYCLIVLVFAALAVEAYINDYAARKLTDSVSELLEKLSVVNKWLGIPKLVTGKDFPKDKEAFRLLKQLVKDRNYIVHNKSVELIKADFEPNLTGHETSEELTKKLYTNKAIEMLKFGDSMLDKAKAAIQALDELAVVMESLDPDELTSVVFHSPVGSAKEHYTEFGIWPWCEEEQ